MAAPDSSTMDVKDTKPAVKESYKYVEFDTKGYVARIVMNHPAHNVLTVPMMAEMAEAIEGLSSRPDIKAIVLSSGLPKVFSAGISLEDSKPDRVFQTLDAFTRIFLALREISKPLIVVVNGMAIGAGSELVAFGDLVVATPNAKFSQPEVKLGVFPPFAAVMLPQMIGPKKTYELILTGEAMSAEEAMQLKFVNKLVPEAKLQETVEGIVAKVGEFSGPVLEMTKKVIMSTQGMRLEDAMKKSHDIYLNQLQSLEDVQEGIRAVLEKRKPVWKNK